MGILLKSFFSLYLGFMYYIYLYSCYVLCNINIYFVLRSQPILDNICVNEILKKKSRNIVSTIYEYTSVKVLHYITTGSHCKYISIFPPFFLLCNQSLLLLLLLRTFSIAEQQFIFHLTCSKIFHFI